MRLNNLSIFRRKSLRINPRGKSDEVSSYAQSVRTVKNHESVNNIVIDVGATIPDEDEIERNTDMFDTYNARRYSQSHHYTLV